MALPSTLDRNEPHDAPANRDDVNDIIEEATNVLEIGDIPHCLGLFC
jgi:hypothetical protein